MLLVTAAEMRALEREIIDVIGVPGVVLMDAAGRGVAEVILALHRGTLPHTASRAVGSVVVYAGAGNNGGDGYVAARHLAGRGLTVEVIRCAKEEKLGADARTHYHACARSGVAILDGESAESLGRAAERTAGAEVVIDALFGTGLERPVEGHFADVIARVNAHAGIKVAVDLPSGLDADRGVPLGVCVRADHTVTFAFAKRGLAGAPGFVYAGRLHVVDLGIPESLARARGVTAELLDDRALAPLLGPLDPLAHKGTRGHLLVIAGSTGKSGAALLAGRAALRAGAGLVTVCAPEPARAALDGRVPELMTASYPWDPPSLAEAWRALEPLLDGKRAVAVGPGVPTEPELAGVLARLCAAARARDLPMVVDADALNHLARDPSLLSGARAVLTPHPGEAARLAGSSTGAVAADRIGVALALAKKFDAVVALKGARTVVAAPDGRLAICPTGNPGLGSGGTGDVLTGATGALLAQGLDPWAAAVAAVYLHGAAGDLVAEERGARGLIASDVADALGRALAARAH